MAADTLLRLADAMSLDVTALVPAWPEGAAIGAAGHGFRTRERRRALGISLARLAAAAGVSEATMSRFERGLSSGRSVLSGDPADPSSACLRLASALGFGSFEEYDRHCLARRRPAGGGQSR